MLKKIFNFCCSPIYKRILLAVSVDLFIASRKRLGKENDGGYVVLPASFRKYDVLLSFGVSNDVSFEKQFELENSPCKTFCFDPTVDGLPESFPGGNFYRLGIDAKSKGDYKSLKDILSLAQINSAEYSGVFMKMDIEGYEWNIFQDEESYEIIRQFDQIAIEFHFKYITSGSKYQLPLALLKRFRILKRLKQDFLIFNLHANNCEGENSYSKFSKFVFPHVVEVSLVNRRNLNSLVENLNQSCDPSKIDIQNFFVKAS